MEMFVYGLLVTALFMGLATVLEQIEKGIKLRRRLKWDDDPDADCRIVYGPSCGPFTEQDRLNAAKALVEMEEKRIAVHKALRKKGRIM